MAGKKKSSKAASRPVQVQQPRDARLNVRMPADLQEQITEIAARENRTASGLIVDVMSKYVRSKKSE
jgi:hypothetical protein